MKERIITGTIMTIVLLPMAFRSVSETIALCILFCFLSVVGVGEFMNCLGILHRWHITVPLMLAAGCAPFLARYAQREQFAVWFCAIMFVLFFYSMCVSIWSKGQLKSEIVTTAVLMSAYISGGFSCAILLRDIPDGYYLFLLIFMGAWITDIFAYFCGMLFGKRKLIPDVSPHKTIAGAVGGTCFTLAAFLIYGISIDYFSPLSIPVWSFALLGISGAVIAQMGDLMMSLFKRQNGIKDYGKIFPGHGGVLDRFDSIVAIAPFLYLLCCLFNG